MADALKKVGFTSFIYNDLSTKDDMEKVVDWFFNQVKTDDTVWIYYAGHGVQQSSKNYLFPTQVSSNTPDLSQTLPAQNVMKKMSKRKGVNIMVLDTCRSSQKSEIRDDLVEVGGGDILIVFSTASGKASPAGSLVGKLSAKEGNLKEDSPKEGGLKEGSPLAKYLVAGIKQLGWLPLENLFQTVGTQVRAEYEDSEHPKYQDSFVYVYGWTGRQRFCLSRCIDTQNITITP
jgi:hypothetical protein